MKLLQFCPLCRSQNIATYAMKFQLGFPHVSRTICKDCQAVFANPMADADELNSFYANYYEKGNFGDLQYKQRVKQKIDEIRANPRVASRRYDRSVEYYDGKGNYLDVGFGLGVHLFIATAFGYKVYGTEFDSDCIRFCKEFVPDAQLFQGDLLSAKYENDQFDTINMCHVIEHLIDPVSYLRELQRIMKPGGTLIVGTPDIGALPYEVFRLVNFMSMSVPLVVDGLEHAVIFNKRNLRQNIEACGFKVVKQYAESVGDGLVAILKSDLSLRKKFVRYCQTKVKINQVVIATKR